MVWIRETNCTGNGIKLVARDQSTLKNKVVPADPGCSGILGFLYTQ